MRSAESKKIGVVGRSNNQLIKSDAVFFWCVYSINNWVQRERKI